MDIGMIKVKDHICSIAELKEMQLAVAMRTGEVEIWSLTKSDAPLRTLRTDDNIILRIYPVE